MDFNFPPMNFQRAQQWQKPKIVKRQKKPSAVVTNDEHLLHALARRTAETKKRNKNYESTWILHEEYSVRCESMRGGVRDAVRAASTKGACKQITWKIQKRKI